MTKVLPINISNDKLYIFNYDKNYIEGYNANLHTSIIKLTKDMQNKLAILDVKKLNRKYKAVISLYNAEYSILNIDEEHDLVYIIDKSYKTRNISIEELREDILNKDINLLIINKYGKLVNPYTLEPSKYDLNIPEFLKQHLPFAKCIIKDEETVEVKEEVVSGPTEVKSFEDAENDLMNKYYALKNSKKTETKIDIDIEDSRINTDLIDSNAVIIGMTVLDFYKKVIDSMFTGDIIHIPTKVINDLNGEILDVLDGEILEGKNSTRVLRIKTQNNISHTYEMVVEYNDNESYQKVQMLHRPTDLVSFHLETVRLNYYQLRDKKRII